MRVIHTPKQFAPPDAGYIAKVLGLDDDPDGDSDGALIAEGMLCGETEFTRQELAKIAASLKISVIALCEADRRFARYLPPDARTRREIAAKLMSAGHGAAYAAEICGLDIAAVNRLLDD